VQEAVERRKVIAFLTNAEVLTGKGSVDYLTQKRVPVIGSETASPWFYESPMYFPQASSGDSVLLGILGNAARLMLPQGKKKMGSLSCNEAQACRDADRVFGETAEKMGFEYVHRGKASLAQPDFTAECLAARNAGVEAWIIVMETSSVNRIANSCARQGYKPTLSVPHSTATDEQKNNPFLDGLITGSMVFPYFQDTTPATQEFQAATNSYRANLATGIALATGWVSGKLLERAAGDLPEPPTSDAILKNLYTLRNDTLGGLTMPLTFTEDKPPAPLACWFDLLVREKKWITPDNFGLHCL
jgi:branched-chain amino acid transport system substrate-binding protein